MRLATYNIKHAMLKGLDAVAATLEPLGCDLVALQEVDSGVLRSGGVDQALWFAGRLGMSATFAPAFDLEGGRYGVALLSRIPVLGTRATPLPSASAVPLPDGREPRVLLEVDLPGLTVAVTHLGLLPEERLAQAHVLLETLGPRTILAGDLNEGPGGPAFTRLLSRFLDCAADLPVADRATFPAEAPVLAIDHVLRTPDLPPARSATRVFPLLPPVSDHLPLVVDFMLTLAG